MVIPQPGSTRPRARPDALEDSPDAPPVHRHLHRVGHELRPLDVVVVNTRAGSAYGDGFTVCCFPVKIRGASAGWTRAVAILDG